MPIYESLLMIYLENFFIGKVKSFASIDLNFASKYFVVSGKGCLIFFIHFSVFQLSNSNREIFAL